MRNVRLFIWMFACVLIAALAAQAQSVTATVNTGTFPISVGVNPVTNKIYVCNVNSNNLTVIDGATNSTTTVSAGSAPTSVAVNPMTNKIYVANAFSNNVTVIDGATNSTTTVNAGNSPQAMAVNPVTNKIYAANIISNNVTVIDGATNSTTTVSVGTGPDSVAVNPVTNKIYVTNPNSNNVTVIDGATNSTTTVGAGNIPVSVAVNPVTNKIYAINQGSNNVTVIDGATNSTTTVVAGTGTGFVAVNPVTNKIYAINRSSNNVTVIDGATNSTTTVTAGTNPISVAVSPVTNKFYVTNIGSNNVTVIDGATNSTTTVGAGTSPNLLAVNPVTDKIYVTNGGSNDVTVIDGATNSTTTVGVGNGPGGVAVNPVTNKIYVANGGSNTVTVIDGATNSTTTVNVVSKPFIVAVNSVTNKIYVANFLNSSNLTVIDGATNTTATVSAGTDPYSVAVNPVTNKIYVTNIGSSNVTVIDGATNSTTTVSTGPNPTWVAVNPVTDRIYVANSGSNTVTVIDGATNSTTTVNAGTLPTFVAVNPVTNKIYVANGGSSNVTVIDGATNSTTAVSAGSSPNWVAVNPVTNQIPVANTNSNNVTVITEQQVQAIPLTTSITPLAGNQTTGSTPSFTFNAQSLFSPDVTVPANVFFQVDTWQEPWTTATGSGPSFTGTVAPLQPGFHILYAYAGDGQEATSEQIGSLLIGNIAAYGFLVTNPCTFTLSPTSESFFPSDGSGSFFVNASDPSCASTAVSNSAFVTITGGGSILGSGTVSFSVAANSDFSSRTGTISVAGQAFTVNQSGQPETFTLSINQISFVATNSSHTQTVTLSSNGPPVSFQATAISKGDWLSVTPTSGATPASLTITANPTGLAPGSYVGSIIITVNGVQAASFSVNLTVQPPLIVATGAGNGSSPMSLGPVGNTGMFSASIPLVTNYAGSTFTATITGPPGISVTPASGTLPALLLVSIDSSSLSPGTYQATLTVNIPDANPSSIVTPLTFTVAPTQPNQIAAAGSGLTFSLSATSAQASRQVLVNNLGPAGIAFRASANQPWIQVSPTSGTTNSLSAVPLNIAIDLNGFAPGTYNGIVTVTSVGAGATASFRSGAAPAASTGASVQIPVHAAVSSQASALSVSQSGLTFQAATNGPPPQPQSFRVLNGGTGVLKFQVTTSTASGGAWLSATPGTGATDTNPTVQVSVNPANLAAGAYYGLVQVSAGGSVQDLTIVLNVAAAGARVAAAVQPRGLVFVSAAGAANPPSQTIAITNPNSTSIRFTSAAFFDGGISWFGYTPSAGQISAGETQLITVQAQPSTFARTLPAGVYSGRLVFAFDDNSIATVALLLVVTPASSSSAGSIAKLSPRAVGACTPSKLLPVFTSLADGFTVPVGWPQTVSVRVVDDCGNPMTTGSVVASFSNGDPPLALVSLKDGNWSSTWVLGSPSAQTSITASAQMQLPGGQTLAGSDVINGSGQANPDVPVVTAGGVVNGASFERNSTLAPGALVSIFGSSLSDQTAQATALPLPNLLATTSVVIAGQMVPLQYTSSGQVNAVLPFGLPRNQTQQLIVLRGSTISVPQSITISSSQPAIFTADGSGAGQGIVFGVAADGTQALADATNPVSAGGTVVMYATGLGAVKPAVADGSASPSSPLAKLTDPITLTIGGAQATVLFAGLAPGFASLYQVNAIVPASVGSGNAVPVVITIDAQVSPTVTIAVK